MKRILLPLSVSAILTLQSCSLFWSYRELHEMDDHTWKRSSVEVFEVEIDEAATYDSYVIMRHVQGFPYAQIAIEWSVDGPGVQRMGIDTVAVIGDDRQYLGEGSGDLWDLSHLFLPAHAFEAGTYTIQLRHLMEKEELPLIMEVGIMLKKV